MRPAKLETRFAKPSAMMLKAQLSSFLSQSVHLVELSNKVLQSLLTQGALVVYAVIFYTFLGCGTEAHYVEIPILHGFNWFKRVRRIKRNYETHNFSLY